MRLPLAVLSFSLVVGGCSLFASVDRAVSSEPPLQTDAETYRAGAEVGLRLTNHTGEPVHHTLCASTLQRKSGSTWRSVPREADAACPTIRFRLAPTETAALPLHVPASAPTGLYRFQTRVHLETQDAARTYVTSAFLVHADAVPEREDDRAITQASLPSARR